MRESARPFSGHYGHSSGAFSGKGDVCLASERNIKWRASGISKTSNPRPKAFSASRFDLELRAQMSCSSVGEYR